MTPSPSPPAMPAELLPCPFCGATKLREGQGSCYFIECEQCFDEFGTTVCAEGDARHDAVAMWNRRPALSRQEQPPTAVDSRSPTQQRLCELIDICQPYVDIGLEVRAELRRALLELYQRRGRLEPPQDVREIVEFITWLRDEDVGGRDWSPAAKSKFDLAIAALSTLSRQSGQPPDGYAYVYREYHGDTIYFGSGGERNGKKAIAVIPLFYGEQELTAHGKALASPPKSEVARDTK